MEIKVQCDCGQKFKFDVEPVNGRMPFQVNCPVCGVDGTARANVLLQQLLPPAPIASAYAPPPPPVAAPAPAPMRPAAMSINRPPALKPAAPAPEEAADETETEAEDDGKEGGVREVKLGWKAYALIAFFVCWGLVASFDKLSRQFTSLKNLVTWVKGLAGGSDDEENASEAVSQKDTLFTLGAATLLFQHSNQLEVAEACAEFWSDKYHQKLYLSAPTNSVPGELVFELGEHSPGLVLPATNGVVELGAPIGLDDKMRTALIAMAESVSRKLHCTNVCAVQGEEMDTVTFIINDSGTPRFRCNRSWTTIGHLEKVTVDGEAWAKGIGFKPGKAGYKGFTMEDAEALTKHLGFKPVRRDQKLACIILSTKIGNP